MGRMNNAAFAYNGILQFDVGSEAKRRDRIFGSVEIEEPIEENLKMTALICWPRLGKHPNGPRI